MEFLEPELDDGPVIPREAAAPVKSKEEKEKEAKEKKAKKSIFESGDISSYNPTELVALFEKHIKKALPTVSELEMTSLRLHKEAFGEGSGANGQVRDFEKFFVERVPKWGSLSEHKPVLLIISASAIRCVEIIKYLPSVRQNVTIAKLFAKHFKLEEQKAFLASHDSPIAIGTPARLLKLGNEPEAPLDFEKITTIIVDTHRDGKDRTVFDVAEIRKELVELLCKTPLRDRLNDGACQIFFF